MGYNNTAVTVGTTPTLVATVSPDAWVLLYNEHNFVQDIWLGGSTVTVYGGTNEGIRLASGSQLLLPAVPGQSNDLYAVASTNVAIYVLTPTV